MNRQNQILLAILAIQILLVGVVFWPRSAASGGAGGNLFGGVETDKVARLTISDATGQRIQLAKGANGWVLPEADDYPVQTDKVTVLLGKITALKTDRLVTQTSASHKRLKVADGDFERLIDIQLADGAHYQLYVGASAGYQTAHIRAGGQNQVYLANLAATDAGVLPSQWIDTKYLNVAQDQVVSFSLQNKNGLFEFEKDTAGVWTMKGLAPEEKANTSAIQSLVGRLAALNMLKPLGRAEQDAYGLKSPSAVVMLKTSDKDNTVKSYTVRIGAKDNTDSSFVAISSESPYYVRIGGLQDIVEKTRQDFIQAPPTPGPVATPSQ
jgi:hypothetical protein